MRTSVSEPIQLSYGCQPRWPWRWILRRLFIGVLIAAPCALSLWIGWSRVHYAEREEVRAALERVPGVKVDKIAGFDDISFNVVSATISIEGKPHARLQFHAPTALKHGEILLSGIGPYDFWVRGHGYVGVVDSRTGRPTKSEFYCNWLEVSPGGDFSNLLPAQLCTVEDVIANYDELLAVVEALPKSGTHMTPKGAEVTYTIE